MKRTTAPNHQSNLYVDQTGSIPGTRLIAEDRNNIQEEICNLLEGYSVTLDGNSQTQLRDLFQSKVNQGVRTTDNVQFGNISCSNLTVSGGILPRDNPVEGSWIPSFGGSGITIPRGIYVVQLAYSGSFSTSIEVLYPSLGYWLTLASCSTSITINQGAITIFSNGSNYRVTALGSGTPTIRFFKF